MYVRYSSNNSGGHWWLTDENWRDLEKAGWIVDWCGERDRLEDRKFSTFDEALASGERYMRALAVEARLPDYCWPTERVAKAMFQEITGQDPDAEGCHCCGQPHNFDLRED